MRMITRKGIKRLMKKTDRKRARAERRYRKELARCDKMCTESSARVRACEDALMDIDDDLRWLEDLMIECPYETRRDAKKGEVKE